VRQDERAQSLADMQSYEWEDVVHVIIGHGEEEDQRKDAAHGPRRCVPSHRLFRERGEGKERTMKQCRQQIGENKGIAATNSENSESMHSGPERLRRLTCTHSARADGTHSEATNAVACEDSQGRLRPVLKRLSVPTKDQLWTDRAYLFTMTRPVCK
jgi:hypothetical protein